MASVVIGVDPAKRSHTVEVIDGREQVLATGRFDNDNTGYRAMRALGRRWPGRVWAVEGASGKRLTDVPCGASARRSGRLARVTDLATERLHLRAVRADDGDFLVGLWTDERVREFLGGALTPLAAARKADDLVADETHFLTETTVEGISVGLCALSRRATGDLEVSYEVDPVVWGLGYGREAVAALVEWAFVALDAGHVVAVTQVANRRSQRLLESVGMRALATVREHGQGQIIYRIDRQA